MKSDETDDERRWTRLRGPQAWTADDANWVLEALAASGHKATDFAKQRGLNIKRLYGWRQRLKTRTRPVNKSRPAPPLTLVPVSVRATAIPATGNYAVVVSTGTVRVEVRELNEASRSWVADLLGIGGAS